MSEYLIPITLQNISNSVTLGIAPPQSAFLYLKNYNVKIKQTVEKDLVLDRFLDNYVPDLVPVPITDADTVLTALQKIQAYFNTGIGFEIDPLFTAWITTTPPAYPGDNISTFTNDAGFITCADVPSCETDPIFSAWLLTNPLAGFITGADVPSYETDPIFSAWLLTNPLANFIECSDVPSCESDPIFSAWLIATPPLYTESDPVFNAWLIATPPLYAETDPVFNAWLLTNPLASFITCGDVPTCETDPVFNAWLLATPPMYTVAVDGITITGDGVTLPLSAIGGGGATVFTDLTDVPVAYADSGEMAVIVKADETGLEFKVNSQYDRGFFSPNIYANVVITYNVTTKKITVSGADMRAVDSNGKLVTETIPTFVSGWESVAHPISDELYILSFDGTDIDWRTTFDISHVLIAIKPKGFPTCTRECHPRGVSVEDHTYHHFGEGTIFHSGGEISNIVLDSFTVADRRPYIADTYLNDDGLITLIGALNANSYIRFYLSNTETTNYDTTQIDIIEVGANNRPYYYDKSSGTWTKTLIPRITTGTSISRQRFCSVWVLGIPVVEGDNEEYGFIFIQPQGFSTSLDSEKARNPAEVLLGLLGELVPEYFIFQQLIIRYVPDEGTGDWNIAATVNIRGSKARPVSLSGIGVMPNEAQVSIINPYTGNLSGATTQEEVNEVVDAGIPDNQSQWHIIKHLFY